MRHVISLKPIPLLSNGILIAFSNSTGGKGKRKRGLPINKQRLTTSQQGYWIASLLSSPRWREQHANNVGGYVCFNIGFLSVVPWREYHGRAKENSRGEREKKRWREEDFGGDCRGGNDPLYGRFLSCLCEWSDISFLWSEGDIWLNGDRDMSPRSWHQNRSTM